MIIARRSDYKIRNNDEIEDIQVALEKLTHDLQGEKMKKIVNFNHTYLVITRRVKNEIKKQSFEHPDFLNRFDVVFADYYFSALKGYLGDKQIPASWRIMFDTALLSKSSDFLVMALGVNAHVNNDIPQVLLHCNAKEIFVKDYKRINSIIGQSLDEVIVSLASDKKMYGPKNIFIRPGYSMFMRLLIYIWRRKAWKNFLMLKQNKDHVQVIESSAASIGKLLVRLPL